MSLNFNQVRKNFEQAGHAWYHIEAAINFLARCPNTFDKTGVLEITDQTDFINHAEVCVDSYTQYFQPSGWCERIVDTIGCADYKLCQKVARIAATRFWERP